MQKHFKLPVYVENDANCVALAESMVGAAEDIDYSVLIRIGAGIGGGIITNNRIYAGFNFAGAELGHMVIAVGGEKCTCGRKGCWEAYASLPALIRQTTEAAVQNPNSLINEIVKNDLSKIDEFTAFEARKLGDATGSEIYDRYLEYLAEGITNITNILMPAAFIISGRLSKLGDNLLKPLKTLVDERVYAKEAVQPEFKLAQIGNAAVVIGAAMLGHHRER
jgi:glucokinase